MRLYLLLLPIVFISCQNAGNGTIQTVDSDNGESLYHLFLFDEYEHNPYYLDENHAKSEVLVTQKVYVGKTFFGYFDVTHKAVAVARKKHEGVTRRTVVSIKDTLGNFIPTWQFDDNVSINDDGSFGLTDLHLRLEEGFVRIGKDYRACLEMIFTESGNGDGYRIVMLYYVWDQSGWKLVRRERVNPYKVMDQPRFCVDSSYTDPISEKSLQHITYSMLYDFGSCKNVIN